MSTGGSRDAETQGRPGECRQVGLELWELFCARCGRHVDSYRSRTTPRADVCRGCQEHALRDGTRDREE